VVQPVRPEPTTNHFVRAIGPGNEPRSDPSYRTPSPPAADDSWRHEHIRLIRQGFVEDRAQQFASSLDEHVGHFATAQFREQLAKIDTATS